MEINRLQGPHYRGPEILGSVRCFLRILVVEDNPVIAGNLYDYLESRGHNVESASDGQQAYQLACRNTFDAILLDLGLPKMDGLEVCRKLREEAEIDTPILLLTARDTLEDKLKGFGSGADDYLVKPFALEEVEVRLQALYRRRTAGSPSGIVRAGDLIFDSKKMQAQFCNVDVVLPPKCVRLLGVLMSEPGRLFSRRDLELGLWGDEQDTSEKLRHHLHLLRRTLVEAGGYDPITTVHGLGYRIGAGK